MKLCSILLMGWLGLSAFIEAPKEVIITGKVNNTNAPTQVTYTIPHDGVFHWGFKASVETDQQGNFQVKIPCERSAIIAIGVDDRSKQTMVVSPGDHFTLQLGVGKNDDSFVLNGPNEAGQALFRKLPNPGFVQVAARKYFADTLVSAIDPKIEEEKAKELAPFLDLLKDKKISQAFFDVLSADRDCYYATMKTQIVWVKLIRVDPTKIADFSPAFKNWALETFQKYPLESPRLISSFWWQEYAKTYQSISMLLDKDFDYKKFEDQYRNKITIHTFHMQDAQRCFKGKYLELFQAYYLYEACLQKEYEKELIALFEQYKKTYPQSPYPQYLQSLVDPIVEYHKAQDAPLSTNYHIMDNTNLDSLDAVLAAFKGKKLYIDVWATWCGPCKREFEYKEGLKKLLNEQGYEILYLSIDDEDRTEAWKGMIKYYKLEGHHLLANQALSMDLRRIYDDNGSIAIPWYLIVNQDGKIVVNKAARPSSVKTLEKQLKEL